MGLAIAYQTTIILMKLINATTLDKFLPLCENKVQLLFLDEVINMAITFSLRGVYFWWQITTPDLYFVPLVKQLSAINQATMKKNLKSIGDETNKTLVFLSLFFVV